MAKSDKSLTIVILNYNVRQQLADCLTSIKSTMGKNDNWQTVVVDNNSPDDSVQYTRKHFPWVKLIANPNNSGFSAGNNIALKKVTTAYTLLLNPDTLVYPGTIRRVLDYVDSHPQVGAATCRVELPDGSLDYSCHRGFPDPWNSFIYFFTGGLRRFSSYADSKIPDEVHEIDALTGAFALIRTPLGKKLKWLDEDFYWNGEDLDFCYRLKQTGSKIVYIPDVKITHYKGSSSGLYTNAKTKVKKSSKVRSANAGIDAMRIFYSKHFASRYPGIFNSFIYLGMGVLRYYRLTKIYLSGS